MKTTIDWCWAYEMLVDRLTKDDLPAECGAQLTCNQIAAIRQVAEYTVADATCEGDEE